MASRPLPPLQIQIHADTDADADTDTFAIAPNVAETGSVADITQYLAKSEAKPSQPFYSHSQRSRIPICVDSSQKSARGVGVGVQVPPMLPTPAPNFGCWILDVGCWSGSQVGSCTRCS